MQTGKAASPPELHSTLCCRCSKLLPCSTLQAIASPQAMGMGPSSCAGGAHACRRLMHAHLGEVTHVAGLEHVPDAPASCIIRADACTPAGAPSARTPSKRMAGKSLSMSAVSKIMGQCPWKVQHVSGTLWEVLSYIMHCALRQGIVSAAGRPVTGRTLSLQSHRRNCNHQCQAHSGMERQTNTKIGLSRAGSAPPHSLRRSAGPTCHSAGHVVTQQEAPPRCAHVHKHVASHQVTASRPVCLCSRSWRSCRLLACAFLMRAHWPAQHCQQSSYCNDAQACRLHV